MCDSLSLCPAESPGSFLLQSCRELHCRHSWIQRTSWVRMSNFRNYALPFFHLVIRWVQECGCSYCLHIINFFTVMWDQSMLHGSLFQKTSSTGHNCCSQFSRPWRLAFCIWKQPVWKQHFTHCCHHQAMPFAQGSPGRTTTTCFRSSGMTPDTWHV